MKTLFAFIIVLAALTRPVLADEINTLTQTLTQSDISRMNAYTQHQAEMAMAFGHTQPSVPTNLNDVAPAAGGDAADAPVPTYTPVAPVAAPNNAVPIRSQRVEDPKNLPLMIGNIPR